MARKKRKKKKQTSKKPASSIPKTANTVRFLIFLAIGLILLAILYFFGIIHGGF